MKNAIAIGFGMALIAAALFVAAGTTNQDTVRQPKVALVFATELHTTPSATPTATVTPTAPPTPLHVTSLDPNTREVMGLLFQYPYRGTSIGTSRARVNIVPLDLNGYTRCLIVTGDRVMAGRGLQVASGAFGALLGWENGEYIVKGLQVYLGHGDMLVSFTASPSGTIVFRFRSAALDDAQAVRMQHTYFLQPCNVPVGTATAAATEQAQDLTLWQCYW
jgi:hypothetical protein